MKLWFSAVCVAIALVVYSACSRESHPVVVATHKVTPKPLVGEFYAPVQPSDPFKHRDWYVKVKGIEKGFVQYELFDHNFRPTDHEDTSCTEEEFRINFPEKVERSTVK